MVAPDEGQPHRTSVFEAIRPRMVPAGVLGLAAVVTLWALAKCGSSLADPDVWWHVRTGRLILDEHSIPSTDPFSFTTARHSWVPTAWLSDALFGGVWKVASYEGIRVLRIAMVVALLLVLWRVAQRHTQMPLAAVASVGLIVFAVSPFLAERPQVLSFFFVVWLGEQLHGVLQGRLPHLWRTIAICWLWANVHGMWVVLPVFLMAAGVMAWCEDRRRVPLAARCTLVAILSVAAAAATPVGPRLAVWPLVVSHVAAPISEWQPTVPLSSVGIPFVLLLAVVVANWARSRDTLPVGKLLFVLACAAFGLSAFRNVAPASLLLLPELAAACSAMLASSRGASITRPVALRAAATTLALGLFLAGIQLFQQPAISSHEPQRIAQNLRSRTVPLRVLNSYNVGGFLTGEAAPEARVAIDGRTDMWTAAYVADYLTDISGRGNWRSLVDRLRPTAAVVPKDSEIARGLVRERGWAVTLDDHGWALLEPRP